MRFHSVTEIWRAVFLPTLGVTTATYTLMSVFATLLHRPRFLLSVLLILAVMAFGLITAATLGAVPSLLIAAVYVTVPSEMTTIEAIVIGCAQGLLISMLTAGIFHRLL